MRGNYREKMEDVLLCYNEGKSTDEQCPDIYSWERARLRDYLSGFIPVYRRWEVEGTVIDPRDVPVVITPDTKPPTPIEAPFVLQASIEVDQLQPKDRTFKRVLMVGEKQLDWLKKAITFYKAYEEHLNAIPNKRKMMPGVEGRVQSVGELVASIIDSASWSAIANTDLKDLENEEKKLKKGEAKVKS
jgi:hypothetical protein